MRLICEGVCFHCVTVVFANAGALKWTAVTYQNSTRSLTVERPKFQLKTKQTCGQAKLISLHFVDHRTLSGL